MKRIVSALLFAVSGLLAPVSIHAEDVFGELTGVSGVESTYVSGRWAHNQKTWRSALGSRAIDLSKGFSALYSYQCYSEESVKKAQKILTDYLKKNPKIQVMMRNVQNGQTYAVYERFSDDGKLVTQMIIWNSDAPNICEVVVIDWNKGIVAGTQPE